MRNSRNYQCTTLVGDNCDGTTGTHQYFGTHPRSTRNQKKRNCMQTTQQCWRIRYLQRSYELQGRTRQRQRKSCCLDYHRPFFRCCRATQEKASVWIVCPHAPAARVHVHVRAASLRVEKMRALRLCAPSGSQSIKHGWQLTVFVNSHKR